MKPESGSQGKGIFLTKNLNEIEKTEKYICQVYISKPFLIDGYKFDMRVYTLISSCDPLRIYVYNEGLVRFATAKYADPSYINCSNIFMHLTNYAVNKHNPMYSNGDMGNKRKISSLNRTLESKGVDIDELWDDIDRSIVKTIISAWPVLKHNYNTCFSAHDTIHACFEILGFDVLLDKSAKPYILEVNLSPSLHTDSALDKEVKESLLADTFTLLNIWQCDKRKILEEDKQRIKERLLHGNSQRMLNTNLSVEENTGNKEKLLKEQVEWEESHMGNYRRVYPDSNKYDKFFHQPPSSLYYSTVSSRARVDCVKQQIEDILIKQKVDMLCRLPSIYLDEEPNKLNMQKDKLKNKLLLPSVAKKKKTANGIYNPVPIVEAEESLRLSYLATREALIESFGISKKVYHMMKEMGTLTSEDERKYAMLDK